MEIARLNNYNSSPEEAFESLSVQLFHRYLYRAFPDQVEYFSVVNGAGGDGGVEAYAVMKDGQVIGLQAKYFLTSLSANQIKQVENSIRTAKTVRPALTSYIVCLPRKKYSEKIGKDGKLIKISEEKKVLTLATKMTSELTNVEIQFWFEDRLLDELGEPGNEGIKRFWYDKEEISIESLLTRFELAKTGWLRERYVPDLHHAGKIAGLIDEMLFNDHFIAREISSIHETQRELEEALVVIDAYSIQNTYFPEINGELDIVKGHLAEHLSVFERLLNDLQNGVYMPVIEPAEDFDVWNLKLKIERLAKFNSLRNITPRLVQSLEKIHQFYLWQYWEHLAKEYHPHHISLLGPVGTGKTHGLANAVENLLADKQAAMIIRAKGTANASWGAILRQTLDCCIGWSDLEILSGLEALAIRTSVRSVSGKKTGEKMLNKVSRVLICIDGIDEAEDWTAWQTRISECQTWLKKFPLIRFVFSARSYPPMNMNPCDLPDNPPTQIRVDLPETGDTPLYDLVPQYFKAYKITYGTNSWIRGAFENAFTLRLFCEAHAGQNVADISKDPMHFTLRNLLNIKIQKLEDEFREKYTPTASKVDQNVRKALFSVADLFKDQTELERDFLRNQLFSTLDEVFSKPLISSLLDMLSDHGFLIFHQIPGSDGVSPAKKAYTVGIQSYTEYLHALKHASHIAAHHLLKLPVVLQHKQMEYTRALTAVILFNDYDLLVGVSGLWSSELDDRKILRLQFEVFSQSSDNKVRSYLEYLRTKFKASDYTNRDLLINEFILPNLYREELNLGVEIVHQTLISFKTAYARDLFWSAPDHHDLEGNSNLSLYLERLRLYPFDNYLGSPLIMVWSLSSIHKSYREKSRSELTDWASVNIEGFIKLLDLIWKCGDDQIQEDLSIVMLGLSAKFTKPDKDQRLLADWILQNIFSDKIIGDLTNAVVRYAANAYIERMFSFGLCSQPKVAQSRPPYPINDQLLALDFSTNPLDNSHEGRFPIQDDLGWYVIGEAFDGFMHYEDGGLDEAGKVFLQPYFDHYGTTFNQKEFAVAAAIKYLKDLGWNETKGPANDGNGEWATFEEKYTWLAVHKIQGYLADRLPYGKFEPGDMLTNYGEIIHIANPAQFGVGHVIQNYHLGADRWLLPEDTAEPIPLTPLASLDDIKIWTCRKLVPEFQQWIALKNPGLKGIHEADDDWIALYSTTALPEPNRVGRSRLTLNCVLIEQSELAGFQEFIHDPENKFDGVHGIRPDELSASVSYGINHSLLDVVWMDKYDEEEPEKWISNQHSRGYQVKSTITNISEAHITKQSDTYEVPSLLLRKAFQIKTTDKRGFFDADEKLKFLMYRRWEDSDTEQKITVVDRKSFECFLAENSLAPIWIAENFRSMIADSPNKKRDDHWQNCTKWVVWGDDYSSFEFHNSSHC